MLDHHIRGEDPSNLSEAIGHEEIRFPRSTLQPGQDTCTVTPQKTAVGWTENFYQVNQGPSPNQQRHELETWYEVSVEEESFLNASSSSNTSDAFSSCQAISSPSGNLVQHAVALLRVLERSLLKASAASFRSLASFSGSGSPSLVEPKDRMMRVTFENNRTGVSTCIALKVPENKEKEVQFTACKELCQLPAKTGVCRGYFTRYHFDPKDETCKSFVYGGCGGNGNNFETKEECLKAA
ncbi:unnamed protein product [Cyprideis torosa]|uniref:Uncharacterized protein n=1 Tax=Cyprideis torosa TaxID=163714 RepID=A0A7R8WC60_9CRUS|nr:unnamed protein product [Cyprideis torosa]CAG0893068.1 unnamed protein product [Cyprideis torosa]